jgi:hypothetical protein
MAEEDFFQIDLEFREEIVQMCLLALFAFAPNAMGL